MTLANLNLQALRLFKDNLQTNKSFTRLAPSTTCWVGLSPLHIAHLGGEFMFKKVVGSFIVASALSVGFCGTQSEASEWNQSSIKVEQSNSGWDRMTEIDNDRMDESKSEINGSKSSMQRHSVNLRSYQLQNGQSKGAATATQKSEIKLDVESKLSNKLKELKQTTEGKGILEQKTVTKNPARILQSQSNTTSVYHFQASIEGGPSIQNQMLQIHNFQFSSVVER